MADRARIEGAQGEVFLDARGRGRALQLTWHPEAELVVFSLWREGVCSGTFRMPRAEVESFVDALVDGLRDNRDDRDDRAAGPRLDPPVADTGHQRGFTEWAFGPAPLDARATAS
jgi:hypothetical protein